MRSHAGGGAQGLRVVRVTGRPTTHVPVCAPLPTPARAPLPTLVSVLAVPPPTPRPAWPFLLACPSHGTQSHILPGYCPGAWQAFFGHAVGAAPAAAWHCAPCPHAPVPQPHRPPCAHLDPTPPYRKVEAAAVVDLEAARYEHQQPPAQPHVVGLGRGRAQGQVVPVVRVVGRASCIRTRQGPWAGDVGW